MIPEAAVEAARIAVRAAMIEFGPDGHTDGDEEITHAALEAAAPHMLAGGTEWAIFRAQGGPNESPAANLRYKTRDAAQRVVDATYSQPQYWEVRGHAVGEWAT